MSRANSILWKTLTEKASAMAHSPLQDYSRTLELSLGNIQINFTQQNITEEIWNLLFALAEECELAGQIQNLMAGEPLNRSENKPALHTALRDPKVAIHLGDKNIADDIFPAFEKMQAMTEQIRASQWLGFTGLPITDIVNIGVGGSDLGPRLCLETFSRFVHPNLNFHFISDADPESFLQIVERLKREQTLFIVSSKSFTTEETLYNARKAISWMDGLEGKKQHFIAITAFEAKAHALGFEHTLPIWNWVGGRYSFCSPINLITAIAIGWEHFINMQKGAHLMDEHFRTAPFEHNLPVLLALAGIWNNNFKHIHNLLVLIYANPLEKLVHYLQQLDMESNGKFIDHQGQKVSYATGPIVWGGLGNQVQHSYLQLLCQGTHKITADFITLDAYENELINQLSQLKMNVLKKGVSAPSTPFGLIPGNIPFNHIRLKDLSPFTLGSLISLYEHKIFTQSVIWNINPFDQPGVESAKQMNSPYPSF